MRRCIDCLRDIRRGVRCFQCGAAGHGAPGRAWVRPGSVCLRRLSPSGAVSTAFTGTTLAAVWHWIARSRNRRRPGVRRWIEASGVHGWATRPDVRRRA